MIHRLLLKLIFLTTMVLVAVSSYAACIAEKASSEPKKDYWSSASYGPTAHIIDFNIELMLFDQQRLPNKYERSTVIRALKKLKSSQSGQAKKLFSELSALRPVKVILNDNGDQLASIGGLEITIDIHNRPYFRDEVSNEILQASVERILGHELSHVVLKTQDISYQDYDIYDVSYAKSVSAVGFMDKLLIDISGRVRGDHSNLILK